MLGKAKHELQKSLINVVIFTTAIISIPLSVILLFQNQEVSGFMQALIIGYPLITWTLVLIRKRLSYRISASLYCALNIACFVNAIMDRGIVGPAFIYLTLSALVWMQFVSARMLIYTLAGVTLVFIALFPLFMTGYLNVRLDAVESSLDPFNWIAYFFMTLALISVIGYTQFYNRKAYYKLYKRLEKRNRELKIDATYDYLTKLFNVRSFEERSSQVLKHCDRNSVKAALLFIDLNDFKEVNDQYGHKTGDLVLIAVGHALKESVRDEDICARVGGDEFVVLLNQVSGIEQAKKLADIIFEKLRKPITINEDEITIGASIGIAIYPQNGECLEELIIYADESMYKHKELIKNRVKSLDDKLSLA